MTRPVLTCFLICAWLDTFYFTQLHTLFWDESRFIAEANALANEFTFRTAHWRAFEMPGTAIFYAPFFFVFGSYGVFVVRFAQAGLCAYQVYLVGDLATVIHGSRAGKIAAWIAALYPFFLFYQGLLLSETLFTFFLVGAVRLLYRKRTSIWVFALASYVKPTLLFWPIFARFTWKSALVFVLLLSPWVARNYYVLGSPVLFTTGSGQNLYLGNNPLTTAGMDNATEVDPSVRSQFEMLPEVERQQAYQKAALNYIRANPVIFLNRAWEKFWRYWDIIPNGGEYRHGIYPWISGLSFGPVLLLALLSAAKLWRDWRVMLPIYSLIVYMTALHCIVIASLRYRLPLEPFLIVMASGLWRPRLTS